MKKMNFFSATVKAMVALMIITGVFTACTGEDFLETSSMYGAQKVSKAVEQPAPADTISISQPEPEPQPQDTLVEHTFNKGMYLNEVKAGFGFEDIKIYSLTGKIEVSDKTNAPLGVTGGSRHEVEVKDFGFQTSEKASELQKTETVDGNWTIQNVDNTVVYTVSNGDVDFNFADTLYAPSAVWVNDSLTVDFPFGKWSWEKEISFSDVYQTVVEGQKYDAVDYLCVVTYTYSVSAELAQPNTQSWQTRHDATLLRKVEETKSDPDPVVPVVPAAAPRFTGMAVSAVPALVAENGKPVDGSGTREAWWSFLFFEEDAVTVVVVPFGTTPTADEVANGFRYVGDYTGCNSALYVSDTNSWMPAIAETTIKEDGTSVLKWFKKGESKAARSIRNDSLKNWGWKNVDAAGHYTTVVDGYSYSFEGEDMLVSYNGQVVLKLN